MAITIQLFQYTLEKSLQSYTKRSFRWIARSKINISKYFTNKSSGYEEIYKEA